MSLVDRGTKPRGIQNFHIAAAVVQRLLRYPVYEAVALAVDHACHDCVKMQHVLFRLMKVET